jgi:subtilase family serine protease
VSSNRPSARSLPSQLAALLSCCAAAAVTACGGGAADSADTATTSAVQESTTTPTSTSGTTVATAAAVVADPVFHMAPAQLDEPADVDAGGSNVSASEAPHQFVISGSAAGLSTTRLTPSRLTEESRMRVASASPAATTISAAVYTPAQIRAAYGLPALPSTTATLSSTEAAAYGAGQTIYIIDAYDHPNAAADLAKFSTKFGLPACASVALTASSTLPLGSAGSTCTFSVAYATSAGAVGSTAPSYDSGWVAEIALDVQWAHAIAPLARIVLIETADASITNLMAGVALASKMGSGVVSMSFGAAEGTWVKSLDASFTGTGMTYVASAGDNGAQALWPAVSPNVLAVGGTSLQWSGSGTRYEAAWSSSGGAVSTVEALPTWQSGTVVPGVGAATMRAVSDVAFNANPTTGQYVALTEKGATTTSWNAYGGTSIGAPQWAGLVAVANARRVLASKAVLGDFHALLYQTIAASSTTYAAAFADITSGSNGSCASCVAATGYDTVTGWGSPNATALLTQLVSATTSSSTSSTGSTTTTTSAAPVVPGGTFTAQTGTAFVQSLGITAPSGVTTTYKLTGAPSGMTVNSAGAVNWTTPVAGSYSFTATATTSAGKSASGTYKLTVTAVNHAPTLASATITMKAGVALKVTLVGYDVDGDKLTYAMTGAPTGMTMSSAGVLTWAKAVKGTYAPKVTVKDAKGLSGTATITVVVS